MVIPVLAISLLLATRGSQNGTLPSGDVALGPDVAGIAVSIPTASPTPTTQAVFAPQPVEASAAAARPSLPAPKEDAQLVRLVIPKAKVDHRVVTKGLTEKRQMEDPGGQNDIAWYNFSGRPGFGSNAVFSGHVDWYTGDRGSFWFLRDLKEGDEARVEYSDGTALTYRVFRVDVYPADDAPVAEITGPTVKDVITMITCDGVFSRASHDYNQRRVVVAERVS